MSLVLTTDFKDRIYAEIQSAIDRDDDGLLQIAIDTAEEEVKGFMGRYDITTLFSASGTNRSYLLMKLIKDRAVFEFVKLANPNMNLTFWKELYDDAETMLDKIMNGKLVPNGWPAASTPTNVNDQWEVSTATRRETRY